MVGNPWDHYLGRNVLILAVPLTQEPGLEGLNSLEFIFLLRNTCGLYKVISKAQFQNCVVLISKEEG